MKIPQAHICHQSPKRLRIRVDSRKGNESYFSGLEDQLHRHLKPESFIETNPVTGSVLICSTEINVAAIAEYAEANGLFSLDMVSAASTEPWSHKVGSPVRNLDNRLRQISDGQVDLYAFGFLSLVGIGVFDLLRSGLRLPAWYTAFWYALMVFIMSAARREKTEEASKHS